VFYRDGYDEEHGDEGEREHDASGCSFVGERCARSCAAECCEDKDAADSGECCENVVSVAYRGESCCVAHDFETNDGEESRDEEDVEHVFLLEAHEYSCVFTEHAYDWFSEEARYPVRDAAADEDADEAVNSCSRGSEERSCHDDDGAAGRWYGETREAHDSNNGEWSPDACSLCERCYCFGVEKVRCLDEGECRVRYNEDDENG